jgi:hypothetical protein
VCSSRAQHLAKEMAGSGEIFGNITVSEPNKDGRRSLCSLLKKLDYSNSHERVDEMYG